MTIQEMRPLEVVAREVVAGGIMPEAPRNR